MGLARARALLIAAVLLLLAGIGGVGYRWMTQSTLVSKDEAVARFRESPRQDERATSSVGRTGQKADQPNADAPAAGNDAEVSAGSATRRANAGATSPPPPIGLDRRAPEPGVYTYRTEGFEQAGVRRQYPPESQRIVTHQMGGRWRNHHIFSDEHEEWFEQGLTDAGGVMFYRRVRVSFGPLTVDRTITFDPPALGVPFPFELGRTWQGSWSGPTSGTYTGKTFDHTTLRIDGENVEVWGNELHMRMTGENEGEVHIKLWIAPRYSLSVKEEADMTMQGGPGTYHSEYTLTILSLTPKR